tara:strand:+ start:21477 stop:22238 length:762 start_codon:yes stop_codon:yes gene_type:complete
MKNSIVLLLILSLSGCTNLQTVTSIEKSKEISSNYKYYDSDSQIRYQVSNNEDFLFLTLNTSNRASIMKIIRTGLTIYFDTNGKKTKETYIQYPVRKLSNLENVKSNQDPRNKPHKMNLSNMISGVPLLANYYIDETEHSIQLTNDTSGLTASLTEENGALTYRIKIPFSKITTHGANSLTNFVVGIESGAFKSPSQRPSQNSGGPSGQGGGGGGRGGAGRPGGPGNGGAPGGGQSTEMTEPIKFWFKVSLTF